MSGSRGAALIASCGPSSSASPPKSVRHAPTSRSSTWPQRGAPLLLRRARRRQAADRRPGCVAGPPPRARRAPTRARRFARESRTRGTCRWRSCSRLRVFESPHGLRVFVLVKLHSPRALTQEGVVGANLTQPRLASKRVCVHELTTGTAAAGPPSVSHRFSRETHPPNDACNSTDMQFPFIPNMDEKWPIANKRRQEGF